MPGFLTAVWGCLTAVWAWLRRRTFEQWMAIIMAVIATPALVYVPYYAHFSDGVRMSTAAAATATSQRVLLDDFMKEYEARVQPAAILLVSFRNEHPDGELWRTLTGQRPAAGTPQQLQTQLNRISAATLTAKGWWTRFYMAVDKDRLPPGFGKAVPGAVVDLVDHDKRKRQGSSHGGLWQKRSNNFRTLVEPYEIANYYNMSNHRAPSGLLHYRANRPYVFHQLEAIEIEVQRAAGAATYQSSLAWAIAAEKAVASHSGLRGPLEFSAHVAPLAEIDLP